MRFSAIFAAACVALPVFGAALPAEEVAIEERATSSLTTLTASVNKVLAANKVVDADALNVTSSALGPLTKLYTDSLTLNTTIANQTAVVNKAAALSDADAQTLQKTVATLVSNVQKLSKDLIAIKKYVVAAGVESIVESTLKSIKTTADTFSTALIAKVPTQKSTGTTDKNNVDTALTNAINAYAS